MAIIKIEEATAEQLRWFAVNVMGIDNLSTNPNTRKEILLQRIRDAGHLADSIEVADTPDTPSGHAPVNPDAEEAAGMAPDKAYIVKGEYIRAPQELTKDGGRSRSRTTARLERHQADSGVFGACHPSQRLRATAQTDPKRSLEVYEPFHPKSPLSALYFALNSLT